MYTFIPSLSAFPAPDPTSYPPGSSQSTKLSSRCYTVGSHQLSALHMVVCRWRFPCGSVSKESARNVKDLGLIPGLGRSPGGGHATHSSILAWRIPMDKGACGATIHGVTKSRTQLSD